MTRSLARGHNGCTVQQQLEYRSKPKGTRVRRWSSDGALLSRNALVATADPSFRSQTPPRLPRTEITTPPRLPRTEITTSTPARLRRYTNGPFPSRILTVARVPAKSSSSSRRVSSRSFGRNGPLVAMLLSNTALSAMHVKDVLREKALLSFDRAVHSALRRYPVEPINVVSSRIVSSGDQHPGKKSYQYRETLLFVGSPRSLNILMKEKRRSEEERSRLRQTSKPRQKQISWNERILEDDQDSKTKDTVLQLAMQMKLMATVNFRRVKARLQRLPSALHPSRRYESPNF